MVDFFTKIRESEQGNAFERENVNVVREIGRS